MNKLTVAVSTGPVEGGSNERITVPLAEEQMEAKNDYSSKPWQSRKYEGW